MSNIETIREDNKNKSLLSVGDLCLSNKYGFGVITGIELDDVWYPISVCFEQNIFEFGEIINKKKYCVYNTKGQTNSINESNGVEINDAKFYKQNDIIKTKWFKDQMKKAYDQGTIIEKHFENGELDLSPDASDDHWLFEEWFEKIYFGSQERIY